MPNLQNNLQKSARVTISGNYPFESSRTIAFVSLSLPLVPPTSCPAVAFLPSVLIAVSDHGPCIDLDPQRIELRPRLTDMDDGDSKMQRIRQRRFGEVDLGAKKGAGKGLWNIHTFRRFLDHF
ncbi:hypothetical protein K435DRAFT_805779 [Dendrothele bispora CBS 962.96]|uniref:Uncharacterized protein n=1 Tax=Dendrothele bispora (strain CBS 962.96) TaxID=1314807 RepID=A0A4S8L9X3_DENBC|nr:hypothetical protein K435DRAFT_805779 [Dendrothele bispora CBS 962.96]